MIKNNGRKVSGSYYFLAEKAVDLGVGGGIEIGPTKWKSNLQSYNDFPTYIPCPNCDYCFDMQKIFQADIEAAPKGIKTTLPATPIHCLGKREGVRCHNSLCIEIEIV